MGNNDIFNHIIEINTDVERRKMAANAMYAMLSNSAYAKPFDVTEIAELAVNAVEVTVARKMCETICAELQHHRT